ncbi:glycerol-3-phosphate 1-O-acyltransferase PlsY [uncultured Desulfuromusa sp.]|uniref:glycerol-3-phosphate 1-O-acyltransferase PlsY n=1 Tax=uncultured Desulfuromusa sp. TaxID=219183 RepID=UPI002AA8B65F|nr:glycerol-3-phosphate 1-O-acyltransferase PlsY [uncultured Desulfuromusa sp.]
MTLSVLLIVAYLIGAIPTGVILTRLVGGKDIRSTGSGNIGATNVYRVAGRKLGIITLVGDCLKGIIPLLIAQQGFDLTEQGIALVALAAFIGHCYPIYLGFKGGKGVATALGIFLILSPLSVLCVLLVFILILGIWRYISLASISAAATIPLPVLFFERSFPLFATTLVIVGIVIWRHRANIERLRHGTENKFKV